MSPRRTIVTVGGIDGSGKSVLATRLAELCAGEGLPAVRLSTDDYRCPIEFASGSGHEFERYYNLYYGFDELDRALAAFLGGVDRIEAPAYDSRLERRTGMREIDLREIGLVILDGVFVQRLSTARASLAIFLETSLAEARRRIIERDLEKGRTLDEVDRRIRERYFPSHERYVSEHQPGQLSDIVIDNERFYAPRLVRMNEDALARKFPSAGRIVAAQLRALCGVT